MCLTQKCVPSALFRNELQLLAVSSMLMNQHYVLYKVVLKETHTKQVVY